MKVKKGKLTFGTIESGTTRKLCHQCHTTGEGGRSSSSTINNGGKTHDLPGFMGALNQRSGTPGERLAGEGGPELERDRTGKWIHNQVEC